MLARRSRATGSLMMSFSRSRQEGGSDIACSCPFWCFQSIQATAIKTGTRALFEHTRETRPCQLLTCLEIVQIGPGHQFPDAEPPIPFVAGASRVPVVECRFIS